MDEARAMDPEAATIIDRMVLEMEEVFGLIQRPTALPSVSLPDAAAMTLAAGTSGRPQLS